MTDQPTEQPTDGTPPAVDDGDEYPDEMVGEPVEPEHDLDVDTFDTEPDEDGDES